MEIIIQNDELEEDDEEGLKIVILKHIFTPEIAQNEREVQEIKEDIEA